LIKKTNNPLSCFGTGVNKEGIMGETHFLSVFLGRVFFNHVYFVANKDHLNVFVCMYL
jgi:hypothetical protein